MSTDERIHRHDFQNGRCKTCGITAEQEFTPVRKDQEPLMSASELRGRLKDLHERLVDLEADRGHTFIIWALIILLFNSCK